MNLPDANHPIWKLLRLVVVGVIMLVLCTFMYRNGFDQKDIVLIVTTLVGLFGYDVAKTQLTKESGQ
jgi:hypothetical protein